MNHPYRTCASPKTPLRKKYFLCKIGFHEPKIKEINKETIEIKCKNCEKQYNPKNLSLSEFIEVYAKVCEELKDAANIKNFI